MTENGYLKRVIVAPATYRAIADNLTELGYLMRVIVTPATEKRDLFDSVKLRLQQNLKNLSGPSNSRT